MSELKDIATAHIMSAPALPVRPRAKSPRVDSLSLPPEIRNDIYKLCLVADRLVVVSYEDFDGLDLDEDNHLVEDVVPRVVNECGL